MRRLFAITLLSTAQACAQEAEPPAEKPPLTAEEKVEIARLLDDEEKRAGRGASDWKPHVRNSLYAAWNMNQEPPPPPLQAGVCDAFDENHELIELTLSNYAAPEPVTVSVPAPYLDAGNIDRYRTGESDGAFLMAAWRHDFAPFDKRRQFYSNGKEPNDDFSFYVTGGDRGGDSLGDASVRLLKKNDGEGSSSSLAEAAAAAGYDDEMKTWRISLWARSDYGAWIAFDEVGRVTDLIGCIRGESNHRCWHEMAFDSFRTKVTYDYELVRNWRDTRERTIEFFQCARNVRPRDRYNAY